jgi:3-isopropylmalate dehydratase small subunit
MGQYTFTNLKGFENFANEVKKGDILIVGKNFGCGSSRQQAVDCFLSLRIGAIIAESFGAIYERNAINSGFPILTVEDITQKINDKDKISINFITGEIVNKTQTTTYQATPFFHIQKEIYLRGGMLKT